MCSLLWKISYFSLSFYFKNIVFLMENICKCDKNSENIIKSVHLESISKIWYTPPNSFALPGFQSYLLWLEMAVSPGLKKKIYKVARKRPKNFWICGIFQFFLLSCSKRSWIGTAHKLLGKTNLFQRSHCIGIHNSAQHEPPRRKLRSLPKWGLFRISMHTRACRIPGMTWPKLAGKEFCSKLALDMQTRIAMKLSLSDLKRFLFSIQSKLLGVKLCNPPSTSLHSTRKAKSYYGMCEAVHTGACHLVQRLVFLLHMEIVIKSSNRCWHLLEVQTV